MVALLRLLASIVIAIVTFLSERAAAERAPA
jgi:hypothetical protein